MAFAVVSRTFEKVSNVLGGIMGKHKETRVMARIRKRVEQAPETVWSGETATDKMISAHKVVRTDAVQFIPEGSAGGRYETCRGDDQWLTRSEVVALMDQIHVTAIKDSRYVAWQTFRVEWREPDEHFYAVVDIYPMGG